jgi:hypothetical protein
MEPADEKRIRRRAEEALKDFRALERLVEEAGDVRVPAGLVASLEEGSASQGSVRLDGVRG